MDSEINLDFYRKIVRKYLELNRFKTAQYWAEKVVAMSGGKGADIYWLAYAMYSSREYQRAAHLIKSRKMHTNLPQCAYLAAICLSHAKEYNEAMEILGETRVMIEEDHGPFHSPDPMAMDRGVESVVLLGNCLLSSTHYERGKMYETLENRELAVECFMAALKADLFCYEAFESLTQHQMLAPEEENALIGSLNFTKQCPSIADQEMVRYLYESKLNKYRAVSVAEKNTPAWIVEKLSISLDQRIAEAERQYYNCNFRHCWKISQEVMEIDPYHMGCLPVYISCLVEHKNSNELFLLAHRLVDIYPENGIAWFAVGCYYYVIGKSDPARRYLGKSTILDKLFGPAWLAYGHSFAAESEHDQAMAAYFKAAQLMIGCHLPLLYIGLENGLTNNSSLAEKFFQQAYEIAPNDPFVLHEMGVIAFQNEQYDKACKLMEDAFSRVKGNDRSVLPRKWEPLLNNLGHAYRKLQNYEKAIEYHMKAMILKPNNYSTHAAIGFCEILIGKTRSAVESFHKALALKRDDTFSTTMLTYVLELHVQEAKDANETVFDVSSLEKMDDSVLSNESSVSGIIFPSSLMDISAMSQSNSRSRFF